MLEGYQERSSHWDDHIKHNLGGVWWRHDSVGQASFAWYSTGSHLNGAKVLHGGAMSTLLDHCMGALAYLDNDKNFAYTMQMNVQFIKPVRANRWVYVTARQMAGNQHNLLLEAEARVQGTVVAKAQGTFVNPVKRRR
jgi:uncharacterized protein (TIGR00369 family)